MDAIPFGMYVAPLELFRSAVTQRISDDEQQYYVQLLHRVNSQSYAVLVASSCDDLLALHRGDADEAVRARVLVTTISRQYLHHHCALIVAPQAAEPLYAAPAAILHDDDLRATASSAWLTYLKVLRHCAEGSVEVRVASQPSRVDDHRRFSTTTLTREQFAQALPIGRRELALATCDLLELVEQHAESVTGRPVEHIAPKVVLDEEEDERETQSPPTRSYPPEVLAMVCIEEQKLDEQQGKQQKNTPLFESVYVSAEIAARTIQRFVAQHGTVPLSRTLRQKAWLQAALFAIKEYRAQHGSDEARLASQDERLRVVLVHGVFRAARLVRIEPVGEPVGEPHRAVYRGYYVRIEKVIAA